MSSYLCFICHSTVNAETSEETREKYREVVGINLCPDSQLCYICCHVLNKLSLFRSICLKRSLEYPVLFSEKGTLNLHKSDLEIHVLCPDDCNQYLQKHNCKHYQFEHSNDFNDTSYNNANKYVELEDDNEFHDYFNPCQYQTVENNDKTEFHYDEHNHNDLMTNQDLMKVEDEKNVINKVDISYNENNCRNDNDIVLESDDFIINDEVCNDLAKNEDVNNDVIQENDTNEFIEDIYTNDVNQNKENNEDTHIEANINKTPVEDDSKQNKAKKTKKRDFKKIILSLEEQKAELERNRKEKKYIEAEFKCYCCALGFLFKETYQAHMMRHEESNGEHQCETCTLRFATMTLLRAHTANHTERYICTWCGVTLKPRAHRSHACTRKEQVQSVSCHLCGNLFKDANGLQQHLRRVHTKRQRVFACNVCGDTSNTHAALRTHMIKHIKRKFRCSICSATYSSPYTRAQHERTHATTSAVFTCACGASYSSRKSLMAHKRNTLNHQQTLLECPICNRICPNQRSLASHMQTVHSTSKEHACTLCPARYTSRKSLLKHVATHNKREIKMAVCHLCGNSFKGNNKLNRHLREVCEKARLEEQISALYE